jgi:hypothetical protein
MVGEVCMRMERRAASKDGRTWQTFLALATSWQITVFLYLRRSGWRHACGPISSCRQLLRPDVAHLASFPGFHLNTVYGRPEMWQVPPNSICEAVREGRSADHLKTSQCMLIPAKLSPPRYRTPSGNARPWPQRISTAKPLRAQQTHALHPHERIGSQARLADNGHVAPLPSIRLRVPHLPCGHADDRDARGRRAKGRGRRALPEARELSESRLYPLLSRNRDQRSASSPKGPSALFHTHELARSCSSSSTVASISVSLTDPNTRPPRYGQRRSGAGCLISIVAFSTIPRARLPQAFHSHAQDRSYAAEGGSAGAHAPCWPRQRGAPRPPHYSPPPHGAPQIDRLEDSWRVDKQLLERSPDTT